jgi:hypothetical protein
MKILGLEFPSRRDARIELAPEQRASPENPKFSLSDPAILDALGIGDDLTTNVSPSGALQSSAVFSCVKVLAESIGQLPIRMYRRNGDSRDLVTDHPVSDLIGLSPNPIMTRVTWFEQQMTQLATWGNCYAQRIFDRRTDRTIALYPLASSDVKPRVTPGKDAEGFPCLVKTYHVRGDVLADEDVLHIPLMSLNGFEGLSPIAMNRMGVSMSLSQQKFATNFYQNGTKLSGALETANKLSKEAAARLRENWTRRLPGREEFGKGRDPRRGDEVQPAVDAARGRTVHRDDEVHARADRRHLPRAAAHDRESRSRDVLEHRAPVARVRRVHARPVPREVGTGARALAALANGTALATTSNSIWTRCCAATSRAVTRRTRSRVNGAGCRPTTSSRPRTAIRCANGDVYLQPMNMVPAGTPPQCT